MSEDYLKIVPIESDFVPPEASHEAAIQLLEEFFPEGEKCEAEVYDEIQFIDQGENLEAVRCSACGVVTAIDFFSEEDPGSTFWLAASEKLDGANISDVEVHMLCCQRTVPFTSLTFEWPAAFARFELNVHNPNVGENLSESQLSQLEDILGCKLTQVRAHY